MALELAILTPLVIVMLLVVVAFGRVTQGRQLVDQAAAAAARAASLATGPGQAATDARRTALDTLAAGGSSCAAATVTLDTSAFRPGGQVAATVACTADLSALALSGVPGRIHLTSTSVSPIEAYRQVLGAAP